MPNQPVIEYPKHLHAQTAAHVAATKGTPFMVVHDRREEDARIAEGWGLTPAAPEALIPAVDEPEAPEPPKRKGRK